MFLLENSFPQKVKIVDKTSGLKEEYSYFNCQEFLKNFDRLLTKYSFDNYQILLYIAPPKNRMISFSNVYSKYGLAGWVNFKDYSDLAFYKDDENKDEEIFEDLFKKFLDTKVSDKDFWQKFAITNIEQTDCKSSKFSFNDELALAGDKLLRKAVLDSLDGLTNEVLLTSNLEKYFLIDEQLGDIIAPMYGLDKMFADDSINNGLPKVEKSKFLANCVKAILVVIYKTTNNYQDVLQIVRDFVWKTDTSYKNLEEISEKYQKISEFLQKNQDFLEKKTISFEQVEQTTKKKVDYQMFIFYNLLEDFGVARITKIDVGKRLFEIKRVY